MLEETVGLSKAERRERQAALMQAESEHLRHTRAKMAVNDFENIKLIGRGAFGEVCFVIKANYSHFQVRIVREKKEKAEGERKVYAMKIINKDFMIQKNQVLLELHRNSTHFCSWHMLEQSVMPWWNFSMTGS